MNLSKWASTLLGEIHLHKIPHEDIKTILHFSDTPSFVYGELGKLIHKIKPAYVVITGDLCDNIQLRKHPNKLMKYERNLKELSNILTADCIEKIYICPSKDDSIHSIRKFFPKASLINAGQSIVLEGMSFTLSHLGQDVLSSPSRFNLFGHDQYLQSHEDQQHVYLNGLEAIHVIDTLTWTVFKYDYPMGTNSTRSTYK